MSELDDYLLSSKSQVTPETLKFLAFEAARGYLQKGASLNETIAGFVREKSLNEHQTDRVAQTANQVVFKQLFSKQASKQVEFPIAKPGEIRAMVAKEPPRPHNSPTCPEPTSWIPGSEKVACPWDQPIKTKVASYVPSAAPMRGLETAFRRVRTELPSLRGDLEMARERVKEAGYGFLETVKRTLQNNEGDLHDIGEVLSQVAQAKPLIKVAMQLVVGPLSKEGVLTRERVGHEKQAHRRADPNHPIARSYLAFESAMADVYARRKVLEETEAGMEILKTAMRGAWQLEDLFKEAQVKEADAANPGFFRQVARGLGLLRTVPTKTEKVTEHWTHKGLADEAEQLARKEWGTRQLSDTEKLRDIGQIKGNLEKLRGPATSTTTTPGVKDELTAFGKGLSVAGIGAAGIGALHGGASALDALKEKSQFRKAYGQAVAKNPDLKKLDQGTVQKHFKALWKFAPDVAAEPTTAGSWLRMTAHRSDIGIDPKSIKDVAEIQKLVGEGRSNKGLYSGALRAIGSSSVGGF